MFKMCCCPQNNLNPVTTKTLVVTFSIIIAGRDQKQNRCKRKLQGVQENMRQTRGVLWGGLGCKSTPLGIPMGVPPAPPPIGLLPFDDSLLKNASSLNICNYMSYIFLKHFHIFIQISDIEYGNEGRIPRCINLDKRPDFFSNHLKP